jgi:hypothetical protein
MEVVDIEIAVTFALLLGQFVTLVGERLTGSRL